MHLLIDTHFHLYPCYDLARALICAHDNLLASFSAAPCAAQEVEPPRVALCLAERADCNAFTSLARGQGEPLGSGLRVHALLDGTILDIYRERRPFLWLVAGRQITTAERLEVLALATAEIFPDGETLSETLRRVQSTGAVAVLPWSPGKWLGARGLVVRETIGRATPQDLILGDIAIRPAILPEPKLLRFGRARDLKILYGSDPLPFAGEEIEGGRLGVVSSAVIDIHSPLLSLRSSLKDLSGVVTKLGRSSGTISAFRRLVRCHAAAASKNG